MTDILIGSDICPSGPNEALFESGLVDAIFGDLLSDIKRADCRVINLECPLVVQHSPIQKFGPVLGVATDCINGLKRAGIDAVSLANNHIMDHGESGVKSTIETCIRAGVNYFGAGAGIEEAGKVFVSEVDGLRIGFYGIVDSWGYCVAGKDSWGANPLDVFEVMKTFRRVLPSLDFLVVLLHAGSEHFPYPSPGLRRLCRFLVEEGAGAVVCQHSHCPGCYEYYQGAPIVYGQGNFVFHKPDASTAWYEGFLVRLKMKGKNACSCEWLPYCQSPDEPGVRRMSAARESHFIAEFEERSREIQKEDFVERKWIEFCRQRSKVYENYLFHQQSNRLLRAVSRRLHPVMRRWLHPARSRARIRNIIQSETFREELLTLLNDEARPKEL